MKLLARGTYAYSRDGKPQPISEPWSLGLGTNGWCIAGQRLVEGKPVLEVESDYSGFQCVAMQVRWHGVEGARGVSYRRSGDTLHWHLDHDGQSRVLTLAPDSELFPLLRISAGPLVRQLLKARCPVVVPNIRATAAADELLHPLLSQRHALIQRQDANGLHCRYFGGEYGEAGSDYWLDGHGLLQRYRWSSAQGVWEAQLENLQPSSGFAGFE